MDALQRGLALLVRYVQRAESLDRSINKNLIEPLITLLNHGYGKEDAETKRLRERLAEILKELIILENNKIAIEKSLKAMAEKRGPLREVIKGLDQYESEEKRETLSLLQTTLALGTGSTEQQKVTAIHALYTLGT